MAEQDLYDVLGVGRGDDAETIRRAYKRKAMQHHPDRDTGDAEAFKRIQLAHDVLTDEVRRKQYDATGVTQEKGDMEAVRRNVLGQLMLQLLGDFDPEQVDIIAVMRRHMDEEVVKTRAMLASNQRGLNRVRSAREKIICATTNFLADRLDQQVIEQERRIANIENTISEMQAMREMLNDFDFIKTEQQPTMARWSLAQWQT